MMERLGAELEVLRGEWADNRRILDEALRLLGAEHYQEIPERIRELLDALHDAELEAMRAERATRRAREAAADVEREREAAQWERQLQEQAREQALRDLERARAYGDEYAERRALGRLRDL